jgi:hypothetical protein
MRQSEIQLQDLALLATFDDTAMYQRFSNAVLNPTLAGQDVAMMIPVSLDLPLAVSAITPLKTYLAAALPHYATMFNTSILCALLGAGEAVGAASTGILSYTNHVATPATFEVKRVAQNALAWDAASTLKLFNRITVTTASAGAFLHITGMICLIYPKP